MESYVNYFKPKLEQFCKNISDYRNCGCPHGLFIPYVLSDYNDAIQKIFYMGQDTYGWVEFDQMMSYFDQNNLEEYLKENTSAVDVNKMLEWKNQAGSFWTLIVKLHLFIRTGRYIEDITTLEDKDRSILSEIGYGNLNSFELPSTLQNLGDWDRIKQDEYWKIKKESSSFDKIKHILEVYKPNLIFIFNWAERDDIFDGLNVKWHKEFYEDGKRAVYTIEGYNTKIIWSSHPRRFSFLGTNISNMIPYLTETYTQTLDLQ